MTSASYWTAQLPDAHRRARRASDRHRLSVFAEMQKRIPNAERIVYENGRHSVFDYLPERCLADALAFLEKHFPEERR